MCRCISVSLHQYAHNSYARKHLIQQVKREATALQQKQSDLTEAQEQLSIQRADSSRKELELALREDQIAQKLQVSEHF
jgi:hypothetical protein